MTNEHKVIHLANEHTEKINREERKRKKLETYKRRRIALIFVLSMMIFTIPTIKIYEAYGELIGSQSQYESAVKTEKELATAKKAYSKQAELLKDPNYVLKVARSKYLYSQEGEKIYYGPEFSDGSVDENKNP
ncbi:MAG: septum formation initiator family protein [Streptococcaceae bacterium]|nr:septum formation initiator family protein [Streptococcaceae bacterium]